MLSSVHVPQLRLLSTTRSFKLEILHKLGNELELADALSRTFTCPQLNLKASILCPKMSLKRKEVTFSMNNIFFKL